MKEIIVFGDLPIATKVCEEILKYPDVKLIGVVLGKKRIINNNDPWNTPPLKKHAAQNNISIIDFETIKNYNKKFYLGISVRFSKIIPAEVIKFFENGIINFHGGLLPEYGGLYSTCHAILNGAQYGGGTIHYIDEGIDSGKILKIFRIEILDDETSISLFRKTQLALLEGFKEIFPKLLKGQKIPPPSIAGEARYYDKDSLKGKKEINFFRMRKEEIYRKVRAFDFPSHEPAYFKYNGRKIYLTTQEFFNPRKNE